MRVLLTGTSGRIGHYVCGVLAEAGFEIRAVDRRYRAGLPVRLEVADLLDREGCYRLLEGMDAVVHLANYPSADAADAQRLMSDNLTMNMNVFQACSEMGVKQVVFASTIQTVTGDRRFRPDGPQERSGLAYLPMDGNLPPNPGNAYALSKVLSEEMLRFFAGRGSFNAVALRLPWVVAAGSPSPRQQPTIRIGEHHLLDEGFTYLPVADCARLVEAVLRRAPGGFRTFQPSARRPWHAAPIPELVARFYPDVPLKRPVEELEGLCDNSGITDETGWEPGE
jgi:nucleoside-diphosphate-sugar epimerase